MDRVSLGIILPGDPRKVQKPVLWVKVLEKICAYGWVLVGFAEVVVLVFAFVEDSGDLLDLFLNLLPPLGFWFVCWLMWGERTRCPYCGHFYTMKRISDDKVISSSIRNVSRKANDYHSGVAFDLHGGSAFYAGRTTYVEHGTETKKTYTYNMRCSCCGCVNKVRGQKTSTSY